MRQELGTEASTHTIEFSVTYETKEGLDASIPVDDLTSSLRAISHLIENTVYVLAMPMESAIDTQKSRGPTLDRDVVHEVCFASIAAPRRSSLTVLIILKIIEAHPVLIGGAYLFMNTVLAAVLPFLLKRFDKDNPRERLSDKHMMQDGIAEFLKHVETTPGGEVEIRSMKTIEEELVVASHQLSDQASRAIGDSVDRVVLKTTIKNETIVIASLEPKDESTGTFGVMFAKPVDDEPPPELPGEVDPDLG